MEAPNQPRKGFETSRLHHISTDEVYGSLGKEGFFTETTPYAPNSPYSASKASSDMLVRAYCHTYGLNVTTTNCSNNYGPKQHNEKLIPKTIFNCLHGLPIPVYGNGSNVRDWLYVMDHCKAIDLVFHQGKSGETYNVGGGTELDNLSLVKLICQQLDKLIPRQDGQSYSDLITFVADRAGHDFRYAIDSNKISKELSWKPEYNFQTGILETIKWFLKQQI